MKKCFAFAFALFVAVTIQSAVTIEWAVKGPGDVTGHLATLMAYPPCFDDMLQAPGIYDYPNPPILDGDIHIDTGETVKSFRPSGSAFTYDDAYYTHTFNVASELHTSWVSLTPSISDWPAWLTGGHSPDIAFADIDKEWTWGMVIFDVSPTYNSYESLFQTGVEVKASYYAATHVYYDVINDGSGDTEFQALLRIEFDMGQFEGEWWGQSWFFPVPEPASGALAVAGVAMLFFRRKRRKHGTDAAVCA